MISKRSGTITQQAFNGVELRAFHVPATWYSNRHDGGVVPSYHRV